MMFLTLLLSVALAAVPERTITVSDQESFDALDRQIHAALAKQPETLRVVIEPGTYRFHDDHLTFLSVDCPRTRLIIEGSGATLVGAGPTVRFSSFSRLGRPVEIVDEEQKLCRIKTGQRLSGAGRLYVQVTSWYQLFTAPVIRKQGRYLYFTVDKLSRSALGYNVNGDFTHAGRLPRFRLARMDERSAEPVTAFLQVTASTFRSLSLSGITFESNTGGRTEYSKDCLLRFYKASFEEAVVEDCTFRSVQSDVIHIAYTDRVQVRHCRFQGCFQTGVLSYNHSAGTQVIDNQFVDMDISAANKPCVQCSGTDYRIAGNRFTDYGNCAIAVGLHFSETMEKPASGVVEGNEISQTEAYRKQAPMNLLMDTGAIYVWTQNSSLLIRDNKIHDISGPGENRGIFCDDGTVNTTIQDNVVERIANSYCIDLRRVLSVETRPDSKIRQVNVGNRLVNNKVDGHVRFEVR